MCVTHNLIFPALEAFEERLDDPTTYFIFYHYFLRAAIGETEWKVLCGMKVKRKKRKSTGTPPATVDTIEADQPLATPLNEAFAMVMLINNYYVWLLEAKEEFGDALITDYDDNLELDDGESKMSLMEWRVLRHFIIDLEDGEKEKGFIVNPEKEETTVEIKEAYIELVKERREMVKGCKKYRQIQESMMIIENDSEGMDAMYSEDDGRKSKRRKILRELKAYTGSREKNQKKYRGWSDRAFQVMLRIKADVIRDKEQYKKFYAAYRTIVSTMEGKQLCGQDTGQVQPVGLLDGLYDDIPTECV
jgi:hypothetical protein